MLDISDIRRIQFDVLIIGAGGAGLSAAISASQDSETKSWFSLQVFTWKGSYCYG